MKRRSERRPTDSDCFRVEVYYRQPDPKSKVPGKSSDCLTRLHQIIREERKRGHRKISLGLHDRVSDGKQRRHGNLDHQETELRDRVLWIGAALRVEIEMCGEFEEVASGWKLGKKDRPALLSAAVLAKKHKAVVVAMDTIRFLRKKHRARGKLPTVEDFENLCGLVDGVLSATLTNPDQP